MSTKEINKIVVMLSELEKDSYIPKNIKIKIKTAISVLNEKEDILIKINKTLQELDDISNDPNIKPYTRTQIWSVVSLLESL